jgi:hypothetical protein
MQQTIQINCSKDELFEMICKAIIEVGQKKLPPAREEKPNSRLLTRREAIDLLGICPATLHNWQKRGLVRYRKIGNRIYFDQMEIEEDMLSHRRYSDKIKGGTHE